MTWFRAAVFIFPLLVGPISGSRCGPQKYPFSTSKCCKMCSPGEEMVKRCTALAETQCAPCESGYYSQDFNEDSSCRPCTICDEEKGLQEVKECEKTSDTVCMCLSGFSPDLHKDRKSCNPCPHGYFSKGRNDMCRPWTNCTARGRNLLLAGSREQDAICDDQPSVLPKMVVTTTVRSTSALGSTTTPGALTTRAKEEPSNHWGFTMIFLLCATVILGMGGSVFCLLNSKQRKKKQRTLEVTCQGDRKSSYRIPIQEEQVDKKSSLVQN